MNDENHCPVGTVNPFKTQMAWVHILWRVFPDDQVKQNGALTIGENKPVGSKVIS
jgi:hypothetical protein